MRSTLRTLRNDIWESKHIRVTVNKHDKMRNWISFQVPILVISSALVKYVSSWFNGILTTRALKFFIWKESKSIFTYWCMIGNCSRSSCAERVIMSKVLKLQTSSNIRWLKWIIVTINEIEKMIALQVWCLKHHLPFVNKVITFIFLVQVPRKFAQKYRNQFEKFGFCVNDFVGMPIAMTWAFLKFNMILWMMREESSEILQDRCQMFLEGM